MFLEKKDVSWGRECALKRRMCFEEGGYGTETCLKACECNGGLMAGIRMRYSDSTLLYGQDLRGRLDKNKAQQRGANLTG